jgi:hypothetical protein
MPDERTPRQLADAWQNVAAEHLEGWEHADPEQDERLGADRLRAATVAALLAIDLRLQMLQDRMPL